jgi:DNA polymerase
MAGISTMSHFPGASQFLPTSVNLKSLREAAHGCRGCDLYRNATQVVFSEGPRRSPMMLLGEMPGDQEDRQGKPFVGPAGRLLDDALDEAGIAHDEVYVTNAVKHFRWEPRGKRRLHKKPSAQQIAACKPWLHAEILVVKPQIIVCLGATAAQVMLGRNFRVTKHRGKVFENDQAAAILATYHPSAILRAPEPADRDRMRGELVADLHRAVEHLQPHAARSL